MQGFNRKWQDRDPEFRNRETGQLLYSTRDRVTIYLARLRAELFSPQPGGKNRKISTSQRLILRSAAILAVTLADMQERFSGDKGLHKDFLPHLTRFQGLLNELRPRNLKPKAPPSGGSGEELGLLASAILEDVES